MFIKKRPLAISLFLLTGAAVAAEAQETPNVRATTLDAVVVTADRTAESKREVVSNITIIDEETVKSSTSRDLAGLMTEQGFQVAGYTANTGSGVLTMRGYKTDAHGNDLQGRVLVLVNGRRVGTSNLGKIALTNVERVEVLRGPATVQYGSAALGGVVNVITKRGEQDTLTGSAEIGFGSFGRAEKSISLAGGKNDFDFAASFQNASVDDYEMGSGETRANSAVKYHNTFDGSLGYTFLEKHRIGIEANYNKLKQAGSPSSIWNPNLTAFVTRMNKSFDINYTGATEDDVWSWMARYNKANDLEDNFRFRSDNEPYAKTDTDIDNIQAQLTFNPGLVQVTGGFDYSKYEIESINEPARSKYLNTAGFLLAKLRLLDDSLIFSAGGRYDAYEVEMNTRDGKTKDNHFSPSAGVAYNPLEWLKLRASWAEAFRMPSYRELGYEYHSGSSHVYGNPDLKPEIGRTWDVGLDIAWNYIDFSATYFQSRYKDYISSGVPYTPASGPAGTTYENLAGTTRFNGFEFSFSVDLGGVMELDCEIKPYVNLNLMTKYEDEDGVKVRSIADKTIGYGVRFNDPGYDLSASINASYFGTQRVNDNKPGSPTRNRDIDHGKFNVVNLNLQKGLIDFEDNGKLGVKVQVNNLFDREYDYTYGYPSPGRNVYIGLNYTY